MIAAALVFPVVLAVNLLPAFCPPTLTVLDALRVGLNVAEHAMLAALLKVDSRRVLAGRRPPAGAPARALS